MHISVNGLRGKEKQFYPDNILLKPLTYQSLNLYHFSYF